MSWGGSALPVRLDNKVDQLNADLLRLRNELAAVAQRVDQELEQERAERRHGDQVSIQATTDLLAGVLDMELLAGIAMIVGFTLANLGRYLC